MRLALAGSDRDRREALPPQLADMFRPEVRGLVDQICAEIRRTLPEYNPAHERHRHALRGNVEAAIAAFVDRVEAPRGPRARFEDTCRALGRAEAERGRGLDSLQAACRVGTQVAWRRVMRVGERNGLPSGVMSGLADALFVFMDDMVTLARDGFEAARSDPAKELADRRRRLLRLVLDGGPGAAELAASAGWRLPVVATPVLLLPGGPPSRESLDPDVLTDLDCPQPVLLVPGPMNGERRRMLIGALAPRPAVVGLTVGLAELPDSLRWARQTLALARSGVVDGGPMIFAEDHLMTLWLLSDPALLDELVKRRFSVLEGHTPLQRQRITETLGAWLEARGNAVEVADRLKIHPQTVRYRMRQIRQTFGDQIEDSNARFGLELAVRAARLRERRARPRPQ